MKAFFSCLLPVAAASALFAAQRTSTLASGWTPLFDGSSIASWVKRGGDAPFEVKNGILTGTTLEGSPNTFLCTSRDYADFELQLEVRADREMNSGIQIRSHVRERGRSKIVYGYQCEIVSSDKCASGNFYDESRLDIFHDDLRKRPGACSAFKDEQWNHFRIVAQGDRLRSWVNGVLCADIRNALDASGFIALQVHRTKAGTGPFQVHWKNIRLRELVADEVVE